MTDAQIALLLQTLQHIEQHLASLAASAEETTRLKLQSATNPVR